MSSFFARVCLVGSALALVVGDGSVVQAQTGRRPVMRRYQGATSEPVVSPYLNMLRPGDPAFNYFTLVQPQVQQQRTMQLQGRQLQGLNRQLLQDERQGPFGAMTQIRPTGGRAATYQNYSHYYPGLGGGGGGGGGGARPARNYPAPSSTGMGGMGMGGGF